MTATAIPAVASPDAQILALLQAGRPADLVVEVGRYRRAWTRGDVIRVQQRHLRPPPTAVDAPADDTDPATWAPPQLVDRPTAVAISRREADVLTGLCHGLSNRDIAASLRITEDTVKTHMRRLYIALGARDRAHAAALACTGALQLLVTVQRPRAPKRRTR